MDFVVVAIYGCVELGRSDLFAFFPFGAWLREWTVHQAESISYFFFVFQLVENDFFELTKRRRNRTEMQWTRSSRKTQNAILFSWNWTVSLRCKRISMESKRHGGVSWFAWIQIKHWFFSTNDFLMVSQLQNEPLLHVILFTKRKTSCY